jgi:hypothetical protein
MSSKFLEGYDAGYVDACLDIRKHMLNSHGARYEAALMGENNLQGREKEISEQEHANVRQPDVRRCS